MKSTLWNVGASSCILTPEEHSVEGFSSYKEAGIRFAELSCCHNLSQIDFYNNPERILKAAEANGVKFTSFHLPFSKTISFSNPDKEVREKAVLKLKETVDAASSIGINLMVMHPSCSNYEFYPEREPLVAQCLSHIGEVYEYCDKKNITLAVENMTGKGLLGTPFEMIRCLKEFPDIKICFDVNHCFHLTPEEYLDELIKAGFKGRIATIHASDYFLKEEKHLMPGEGTADFAAVTKKLQEMDYKGVFMYEISGNKETGVRYTTKAVKENFDTVIKSALFN